MYVHIYATNDIEFIVVVEQRAVIHAHKNKDVCNPVLRMQSNATLQYYSG